MRRALDEPGAGPDTPNSWRVPRASVVRHRGGRGARRRTPRSATPARVRPATPPPGEQLPRGASSSAADDVVDEVAIRIGVGWRNSVAGRRAACRATEAPRPADRVVSGTPMSDDCGAGPLRRQPGRRRTSPVPPAGWAAGRTAPSCCTGSFWVPAPGRAAALLTGGRRTAVTTSRRGRSVRPCSAVRPRRRGQ